MRKRNLLLIALLPLCMITITGCNSDNKSSAETLKHIGLEISASGKASMPEEIEENEYLLQATQQMLLNSSMFVYTQGLYIEENIYNSYNKIVKIEIPNGDGTSSLMGQYINADTKQNTIDIYSLSPNVVPLEETTITIESYSMMHIEYDFITKEVNDYWYTFSSITPIYNSDNKMTGANVNYSNVNMLHRKNGVLYFTSERVDVGNPSLGGDINDPDYQTITTEFESSCLNFKEKVQKAKASSLNTPSSDFNEKLNKVMTDLQAIYEAEDIIKLGELTHQELFEIVNKHTGEYDFNSFAEEYYENGRIEKIDYYSKNEVRALDEYHIYGGTIYEIVFEDSKLFIKSTQQDNGYEAYYDYFDFKCIKQIHGQTLIKYRYFYGDDYCDASKDDYLESINLLKNDKLQMNVYFNSNPYLLTIDGDNAILITEFGGKFDLYWNGEFYHNSIYYYVNDEPNYEKVDTCVLKELMETIGIIYDNNIDKFESLGNLNKDGAMSGLQAWYETNYNSYAGEFNNVYVFRYYGDGFFIEELLDSNKKLIGFCHYNDEPHRVIKMFINNIDPDTIVVENPF